MDGSYWMHTNTSAYVRAQRQPQLEREAWDRYACLYLERIRPMVVREQPEGRYWNALVSDNMSPVDPEWKTLRNCMDWAAAGKHELLVDFVMLLVYYMDNRFFTRERLSYVHAAVVQEMEVEPPLVRRAREYIVGHQADPIDLDNVAKAMHVTRSTFAKRSRRRPA